MSSQNFNRYSYVNNNPIMMTDPSGHRPAGDCEADAGESCGGLAECGPWNNNCIKGKGKGGNGGTKGQSGYNHNDLNYDKSDKTIDYIYDEMTTNINSSTVDSIKEDLDAGNKVSAYLTFSGAVGNDEKWDHKPLLGDLLGLAAADDYYFPIRGDTTSEWYYDIWSNIHAGYVGSAAGFSGEELQFWSSVGGVAGRNDAGDVLSLQIGIDLWEAHGADLTQDQLHDAILSNKDNYLALQAEDKDIRIVIPSHNGK